MKNNFYITTTLPYVNNDPHVGFAMEIIRADIVARQKKMQGCEVFFNTGTDEHGMKLFNDAVAAGKDVKAYVDEYAEKFRGLQQLLGLSEDINFIRTTDTYHEAAAQAFWTRCKENGYIYKKTYQVKYCVGCELEKTDSELVDGKCPIHPNKEIELIDEENYFFKFSEFQQPLLDLYKNNPTFVIPDFRFNEIKAFVERGLEDFSISRVKNKMPWGVAIPDDEEQVMYVWFDALVNYISAIGWPTDMDMFEKWWPVTQYCGKDNIRQQAAMWQAMLLANNLPPSKQIIINGFVTGDGGIKMSKSLGNVINPYDVVAEYGADALRYYVARELHPFEDSPFTMQMFKDAYNANLANGLGNLVSRIMKMAESHLEHPVQDLEVQVPDEYVAAFESFELNKAADIIWKQIGELDAYIAENQPFKVIKEDKEKALEMIELLVRELYNITFMLQVFMPETAAKIEECISSNKMPSEPLFVRKD